MRTSESQVRIEKPLRLAVCVVIERDGPAFHAYCPGLKGIHVDAKTLEEALENAKEAAKCYVASLVRHGDPLHIGPCFTAGETPLIPPGALLRNIAVQCTNME